MAMREFGALTLGGFFRLETFRWLPSTRRERDAAATKGLLMVVSQWWFETSPTLVISILATDWNSQSTTLFDTLEKVFLMRAKRAQLLILKFLGLNFLGVFFVMVSLHYEDAGLIEEGFSLKLGEGLLGSPWGTTFADFWWCWLSAMCRIAWDTTP